MTRCHLLTLGDTQTWATFRMSLASFHSKNPALLHTHWWTRWIRRTWRGGDTATMAQYDNLGAQGLCWNLIVVLARFSTFFDSLVFQTFCRYIYICSYKQINASNEQNAVQLAAYRRCVQNTKLDSRLWAERVSLNNCQKTNRLPMVKLSSAACDFPALFTFSTTFQTRQRFTILPTSFSLNVKTLVITFTVLQNLL